MAEYEGPISQDAIDYMTTIRQNQADLNHHFTEMAACMKKMADLQAQADLYRDKAANHKQKMLSAERALKDNAAELRDELIDNLKQAEAEAGPATDVTGDIGRQI